MITDELSKYDKFIIFGAQVIAYGAYKAIACLTGKKPEAFAVSSEVGNLSEIEGIKVDKIDNFDRNIFVVVGVTELVQKEVLPALLKKGFKNIFALDQHQEHLLMSTYYNRMGLFPSAESNKTNIVPDIKIFEVMCHKDKKLKTHKPLKDFEVSIQAGTDLTDERITSLRDNTGENISKKNLQYCEMTATYWVWKNCKNAWVGIEHYRRHLKVLPEYVGDNVDVIMPLPYMCFPDEKSQFKRFISNDVYDTFMRALKEVHPTEFEEYNKIVMGQYQYTYNLVCARKTVFDDYCKWFFEITEHIEKYGDIVPEIKETRALSYIAEVLTNIYFMTNRDRLRIRHVEKEIYV